MAFTRTRSIGGKRYRYLERRWRDHGKVKSQSIYLGRVPDEQKGLRFIERQTAEYPRTKVDQPSNEVLKENSPKDEGEKD